MVPESSGKNVISSHEIVRITSKLTTKTANSLLNTNIKLNLSNPSEVLKTIDNPSLTDKETIYQLKKNRPKLTLKRLTR